MGEATCVWGEMGGTKVRTRRLIAPLAWVYPQPEPPRPPVAHVTHNQEGRLPAVIGSNRYHAPSDALS